MFKVHETKMNYKDRGTLMNESLPTPLYGRLIDNNFKWDAKLKTIQRN